MLSKRLVVLYLIHKGLHYSEIADAMAISVETVNKLKYRYLSYRELFLPLLEELERVEERIHRKSGKENPLVVLLRTQPSDRMRSLLARELGL